MLKTAWDVFDTRNHEFNSISVDTHEVIKYNESRPHPEKNSG